MSTAPLIEFERVDKAFGDCVSSRGLSFSVRRGSIHGIIGENGAGKSTAMKMLFGMHRPDAGRILIDGRAVDFDSPIDAMKAGIGMVHQHFMLAGPMSALDNLLVAEDGGLFSILHRARARKKYGELAAKYGFAVNVDATVEDLPVGVQQRLEILKVLARDSRILILDEPTAVLTPPEVREFFAQLRRLRDEGRTILIISHKLREIMDVTDEITVLRKGEVVARRETARTSVEELAELMIGKKDRRPKTAPTRPGSPVLHLEKITVSGPQVSLRDIDLEVRAGEIVGIAGVEGNGQDLLTRLLAEGGAVDGGRADMLGLALPYWKPARLRARGAAFFPEDRLRDGMLENRPAFENFLLGRQNGREFRRGPFVDFARLRDRARAAIRDYDVQPDDVDLALGRYSGGNQQKFVVARELSGEPRFILAAQPTRGVDIGAVRFIHGKLLAAKARGAGLLLISSELEELMELGDRILVLYRGRLIAEFRAPFDEMKIGRAMGGQGADA